MENSFEAEFAARRSELMLPPHHDAAEESILGGILLDPEAINRVIDLLCPEAFYVPQNRIIYKAALSLYGAGQPTDLMIMSTWLQNNGLLEQAGGISKLAQLVDSTVSAVNIDRYATLIMGSYKRRQLIQAGNEIVQLGYELSTELEQVINSAEQKLFEVTQGGNSSQEVEPPLDILLRVYENARQPKSTGLLSGIYDLDKLIGGFNPQELYIVAGRPGMGKTQFGVNLAAQAVKRGQPVVFFSAEMDRDRIMARLLAWESGIDSKKIKRGGLLSEEEYTRLGEAVNRLSDIPLYLDDTPGSSLSPAKIRSSLRRATAQYGQIGVVILDYLQLMGDDSFKSNRVSELDKISRNCKAIASEFRVPFVALAQLNRGVESRNDKRPTLSDLRESGSLEQDADLVIMLYRDEYYNANTPDKGICEVIVAKQRDGETGTVKTLFRPETSRFDNLAQSRNDREYMPSQPEYLVEDDEVLEEF